MTTKIERVPLADLVSDPRNPRLHPERNLETIRLSLEKFGQVLPVLVDGTTNVIIGGNGTVAAMRALGMTHADVIRWTGTDQDRALLRIVLNRSAELAEWDYRVLAEDIATFDHNGLALDDWGWTADELNPLRQSTWFADATGKLEDHGRTFTEPEGGGTGGGAGGKSVTLVTVRGPDLVDYERAAVKLRETCEGDKTLTPGAVVGRLARYYLENTAARPRVDTAGDTEDGDA